VKSSVTKTKDANTMNSAIVAAALVRAIFITRRSPKAMDIMELTAIRWNETMPSQDVPLLIGLLLMIDVTSHHQQK